MLKHKYSSMSDMEEDMALLFQNARIFNEEGSQVREVFCGFTQQFIFLL